MSTGNKQTRALEFDRFLKELSVRKRYEYLSDDKQRQNTVDFAEGELSDIVIQRLGLTEISSVFDIADATQWQSAIGKLLVNTSGLDDATIGRATKCFGLLDLFCQEQGRQLRLKNRQLQKKTIKEIQSREDALQPKETQQEEAEMAEGALRQVSVTTRERSKEARQACLRKYGKDAYVCQACGFNFEKFYGPDGKEYIEVHHLNPIATTDGLHSIDPAEGLVPLCSNCHSMIHRAGTDILHPISLEQLKDLIRHQHLSSLLPNQQKGRENG